MFKKVNITICSSSRFYGEAKRIAEELQTKGLSVYTPRFDYNEEERSVGREEKFDLTKEFLQKIEASGAIYIVNPGGYVGLSVSIETGFAYAKGIKIFALSKPSEPAVEALTDKIVDVDELIGLCKH